MTTLRELVTETPEVVAAMRSSLFFGKASPKTDEPDESKQIYSFGPKPPCNVDLIDWADVEAATLIAWAEHFARKRIAGVWRNSDGLARGLLYDDLRPVLIARDVFLDLFDSGWHDDPFENAIRGARRRTCRRFDFIRDGFDWDQEPTKQDDEAQMSLNI